MSLAAFEKVFDEIKHAENFDSARFAMLQGLHQRLNESQHKSNNALLEKALSMVEKYRLDLQRCQDEASLLIDEIRDSFSEHSQQAEVLFNKCEFTSLQRFSQKLKRDQKAQECRLVLTQLNDSMNQQRELVEQNTQAQSLDEVLHQQEQAARTQAGCVQLQVSESHDGRFELKSMKGFRESKKYFNIDKIISRAIHDYPENAGPHNPHMLIIKSLMHMRDLSPQYLRRFAGYAETILWLEKNSVKLNRKKTP